MDLKNILAALLITISVLGLEMSPLELKPSKDSVKANVSEVTDGDTIKVSINGKKKDIRFIGVDTPEIYSKNKPKHFQGVPNSSRGRNCLDKWGKKSKKYLKDNISQQVLLKYEGARTDRYGRIRAHIIQNKTMINFKLVKEGYATVYPTDFSKREKFEDAEVKARNNRKNVWECVEP